MADEIAMRMAIDNALIDSSLVMGKAREILRLLNMRMPSGCLKKAEACRHIIAIEIACRMTNISFDKNKLVAQAPVNSKVYQDTLLKCKNVLNLKWEASSVIDVLAVQFGLQLKTVATTVLEQYRVLYVDKLEKIRQAHVDLTSPVYQAAAFYVGAKSKKVNLDKNKIAQMAEVDVSFFRTVIDSMIKVTADTTLSLQQQEGVKPSSKASKKRTAEGNINDSHMNHSSSSAASSGVVGYPTGQSQRREEAYMSANSGVGVSINGIEYDSSVSTAQPHRNNITDNSSSSSSTFNGTHNHGSTSSSSRSTGSSSHGAASRENMYTNVGNDRNYPIPIRENNTLLSINPKGWLI